jgi:hypothetical protein
MRAGPLSNSKVIDLLNRYFVPVYSSNEDSGPRGQGSPQEKAEHIRIFKEASKQSCGSGSVYVYILNPEGQVIDGLHVARATQGDTLAEMLENVAQNLHTVPGPPVVPPAPRSRPPSYQTDSLVLHLTARGSHAGVPWRQFPAENWIVLNRAEWMSFLPSGEIKAGSSWAIRPELTRKLLSDFYPQMEELDSSTDRNRIDEASLKVTVLSATAGRIQARLDGTLTMKRSFFPHQEDNNFVKATLLGWMELDTAHNHVDTFQLVTKTATYGAERPEEFSAALESLSPAALKSFQLGAGQ